MVLIAGIGGIAIVGILLLFVFIILLMLLAIFKGNKRRGYRRSGSYITGVGEQFVEVGTPDVSMGQETAKNVSHTKGPDHHPHHSHPHHPDHSMPSPTHHIDHTPPPPPMHHHG
jgi:hypothetical protein